MAVKWGIASIGQSQKTKNLYSLHDFESAPKTDSHLTKPGRTDATTNNITITNSHPARQKARREQLAHYRPDNLFQNNVQSQL